MQAFARFWSDVGRLRGVHRAGAVQYASRSSLYLPHPVCENAAHAGPVPRDTGAGGYSLGVHRIGNALI